MPPPNSISANAPGLSTAHIGPRSSNLGTLTFYQGGNLASLKAPTHQKPSPGGGGPRGQVLEFSRASRRRMMQFTNSINFGKAGLPYFVTLTYHEDWPKAPSEWKAQLKALTKRIERVWGSVTLLWRLEFQKRGAPHFHLLLWLHDPQGREWHPTQRLLQLQNNISWFWNAIVDPHNPAHLAAGTNVQGCRNLRHMNAYLSKYMAKPEQLVEGQTPPGRFWGKWRAVWLPIEPVVSWINERQFVQLRRVLARKSRQRIYCPSPRPDGTRQVYGLSAFCGSEAVGRLLAWLGIIGSTAGEPA